MSVVSTIKMTARQFLELGEDPVGVRLELVDGEVAVGLGLKPLHSRAVTQLITILQTFIASNELGELYKDANTLLNEFRVRRPDPFIFLEKSVGFNR